MGLENVKVHANSIVLTEKSELATAAFTKYCARLERKLEKKSENTCWVKKGENVNDLASDMDSYITLVIEGKLLV